jgi:hypothetical protein
MLQSPPDDHADHIRSVETAQPLPLPDKPSIAVLPFQNMSGDPEQEYFADGLAQEAEAHAQLALRLSRGATGSEPRTLLAMAHVSQRPTWPPSAAVRQRSIALMAFIWPRLTWPALARRHAAPWSLKISATSSAGRDTAPLRRRLVLPALPGLLTRL